jgi:predicted transport protein
MVKCRAFKRVILSDSSVTARSFRSNSEKLVASGVGGAHFGAFLPVIIEYKRATNENVINQGLYYLDWLMDHKAEFELLVLKRFGQKAADSIEWATPRLLCIAGDFTKYDGHAVQQINRNIELIRYSWFGDQLLLLELVNATTADPLPPVGPGPTPKPGYSKSAIESLAAADQELSDRFEGLKAFLLALGDDVQMKTLKYYFAFKRFKNFVCAEVHPQAGKITLFVQVEPDTVELQKGFTRDVRTIGHYGTGALEVILDSDEDFELAKPLLMKSYQAG